MALSSFFQVFQLKENSFNPIPREIWDLLTPRFLGLINLIFPSESGYNYSITYSR